ncbi:MAG: hypothetical protein J3Q66DRAFT_344021 [Benniella sp.]|nr:MAG: hypothetical protein J3Q66DRAFT_344021 [Benniella sp.]
MALQLTVPVQGGTVTILVFRVIMAVRLIDPLVVVVRLIVPLYGNIVVEGPATTAVEGLLPVAAGFFFWNSFSVVGFFSVKSSWTLSRVKKIFMNGAWMNVTNHPSRRDATTWSPQRLTNPWKTFQMYDNSRPALSSNPSVGIFTYISFRRWHSDDVVLKDRKLLSGSSRVSKLSKFRAAASLKLLIRGPCSFLGTYKLFAASNSSNAFSVG